jgi:uncharacterized damage-inducible protein DinB
MLADWLGTVVIRDLESLRLQLEGYEDESDIWKLAPGVTNSAGTLVLHLAGNLQHFIGARLGRTGYVRDREAEFITLDVARADLLRVVEEARSELQAAFEALSEEALDAEYPDEVAGVRLSTGQFLIHLAAHLAYHLGQIDYHRRYVTGGGNLAGMQSMSALA